MRKVLLVVDDYSELVAMEILLKKVGFDTIGITKTVMIEEKILELDPDVMIIGNSAKINGLEISKKFKSRTKAKIVLAFLPNHRPSPKEFAGCRIDSMLSIPVKAEKLLELCSTLCGEVADKYVSKFRKIAESNDSELNKLMQSKFLSWDNSLDEISSPVSDPLEKKVQSYISAVKDLPPPPQNSLNVHEARLAQEKLEKSWDTKRIKQINAEKQAFAKALFAEGDSSAKNGVKKTGN